MASYKVYAGGTSITSYFDAPIIYASRHDFEYMGSNRNITYKGRIGDNVDEIGQNGFRNLIIMHLMVVMNLRVSIFQVLLIILDYMLLAIVKN